MIDFVDDFGLYAGWYKKRQKCYKKLNVEVWENLNTGVSHEQNND